MTDLTIDAAPVPAVEETVGNAATAGEASIDAAIEEVNNTVDTAIKAAEEAIDKTELEATSEAAIEATNEAVIDATSDATVEAASDAVSSATDAAASAAETASSTADAALNSVLTLGTSASQPVNENLAAIGESTIYLMGLSFIVGSLFTILILVVFDFMRRNAK